jgi:hypothetical protein
MAAHFLATVYGKALTFDAKAGGWQTYDFSSASYRSFPSAGTEFIALSPTQVIGGVTCAALIKVLPQGLNQPPDLYATDSTVSTLNTNAA